MKKNFRLPTFFFAILLCTSRLFAQQDEPVKRQYLGLDIGGIFRSSVPGLSYQYENKSLQLRARLQAFYGATSNAGTTSYYLSPAIGAAWITYHQKFSFYAGSDFNFILAGNYSPIGNKAISQEFGLLPLLGFKYAVHDRFQLGVEDHSTILYDISRYSNGGPARESFSFNLFNIPSLMLLYRL